MNHETRLSEAFKEEIVWIDVLDALPLHGSEVLVCYERNDCSEWETTVGWFEPLFSSEDVQPWSVDGGCHYFGYVLFWAHKPSGPSLITRKRNRPPKLHSISMNDWVKVKLTDYGRSIYQRQRLELKKLLPNDSTWIPTTKHEDKLGWSDWVLWELFETFGEHITLCSENCFELEIKVALEL